MGALIFSGCSLYFSCTNSNRIYQLEINKQRPVVELNYPSKERFLFIENGGVNVTIPLINNGKSAAKEFKAVLNIALVDKNKVIGVREDIFPSIPYVRILPGGGVSPTGWYELSDKTKFVDSYGSGSLKILVGVKFSYKDSIFNNEFSDVVYVLLDKNEMSPIDKEKGKSIWEKIRNKQELVGI